MIEIAINNLSPGAQFKITDGVVEWLDASIPQPTSEQIAAELAILQADFLSKDYQRKREKEYPSFAEQFDILYHGGYEAWKTSIQAIKNKYPKPE